MSNPGNSSLRQNALLLIVSSVLTLVLAEAAFRLLSKATEADTLDAVRSNADKPAEGASVGLGHMVQLSDNPEIIYELTPGISVNHIGVPVKINASGFRGPWVAEEKPQGVRRIVGIGDSVMYGWGVEEHDAYLEILKGKLNGQEDNLLWEIINTAVPGYNTVMEVKVLEDKGLRYQPDIVILGFVENDFALPRFVRQPVDYLALDRSFILDRIRPQQSNTKTLTDTHSELQRGFAMRHIDMETVPAAYRHMVGLKSVLSSLANLKALSDEHRFEVILLAFRHFPKELRAAAKSHGFHLLNASTLWKKHMEATDPKNQTADFQLNENDPHPSAAAHQAIAAGLYNLITTRLIVEPDDSL